MSTAFAATLAGVPICGETGPVTSAWNPQEQNPYQQYAARVEPAEPAEPPRQWPWYGIGFLPAVRRGYQKYAVFSGRASRSEFWWWALGQLSIYLVLGATTGLLGTLTADSDGSSSNPVLFVPVGLIVIWLFGSIVPSIAISVRRLHDTGMSGALYWLNAIPYVGSFVVLILCIMPSAESGKRFDPPEAGQTPPVGLNTFPAWNPSWSPGNGNPVAPWSQPTDQSWSQLPPEGPWGQPPPQG